MLASILSEGCLGALDSSTAVNNEGVVASL